MIGYTVEKEKRQSGKVAAVETNYPRRVWKLLHSQDIFHLFPTLHPCWEQAA